MSLSWLHLTFASRTCESDAPESITGIIENTVKSHRLTKMYFYWKLAERRPVSSNLSGNWGQGQWDGWGSNSIYTANRRQHSTLNHMQSWQAAYPESQWNHFLVPSGSIEAYRCIPRVGDGQERERGEEDRDDSGCCDERDWRLHTEALLWPIRGYQREL